MAQEGISVSQTVDDYMREMEVDLSTQLRLAIGCVIVQGLMSIVICCCKT